MLCLITLSLLHEPQPSAYNLQHRAPLISYYPSAITLIHHHALPDHAVAATPLRSGLRLQLATSTTAHQLPPNQPADISHHFFLLSYFGRPYPAIVTQAINRQLAKSTISYIQPSIIISAPSPLSYIASRRIVLPSLHELSTSA